MTEAVRVLDPTPDDDAGAVPRPPEPGRSSSPKPLAAIVVAAAVVVALSFFLATDDAPAIVAPQPEVTEPLTAPPPAAAVVPTDAPAFVGYPAADAIAAFETFATMIDRGDSRAVIDLMFPEPPRIPGLRSSGWPHLPTEAEWWVDGVLDEEQVAGFVHYISTLPGSVFLSECDGVVFGEPTRLAMVTCPYETTGGPLAALGQQPERGHLHATVLDGLVASVERHGTMDRLAWAELAAWAAKEHPELYTEVLGTLDDRRVFDPVYTGDSALAHIELAEELAKAQP